MTAASVAVAKPLNMLPRMNIGVSSGKNACHAIFQNALPFGVSTEISP